MRQISKYFPFIFIALWALFYAVNNYVWLKYSLDYPDKEELTTKYYHLATTYKPIDSFGEMTHQLLIKNMEPLYYISAVAVSNLLGVSYRVHVMSNLMYFILLLVAVYLLCKKLIGREGGLIAVSLVSLYPGTYCFSRYFFQEFAVAPFVALTVWLLLKTEHFGNRRYSLVFGAVLAVGMLFKRTLFLFVIGPVLYVIAESLYVSFKDKDEFRKRMLNVVLSMLVCVLFCGYRYFDPYVIDNTFTQFVSLSQGFQPFAYFNILLKYGLLSMYFCAFIVAFTWIYILGRIELRGKVMLLLMFMVPFSVLSVMLHVKMHRHIVPLLPAVAIITSIFIRSMPNKYVKTTIMAILALFGLVQYYNVSFDAKVGPRILRLEKGYNPAQEDVYGKTLELLDGKVDLRGKPKVLFLVEDRYWQSVYSVFVWKTLEWLKDMPFEPMIMSVRHMKPENVGNFASYSNVADVMLYFSKSPVVSKNDLAGYIDTMVKESVAWRNYHDARETNYQESAVRQVKADFMAHVSKFKYKGGYPVAPEEKPEEKTYLHVFDKRFKK
ncbi:MAG: glycosyltransferase family 39 protein [Endomicrobiales bacterium]|nr:glycosyltransferase family 39 protein [Endomicrobiales bacterium]